MHLMTWRALFMSPCFLDRDLPARVASFHPLFVSGDVVGGVRMRSVGGVSDTSDSECDSEVGRSQDCPSRQSPNNRGQGESLVPPYTRGSVSLLSVATS